MTTLPEATVDRDAIEAELARLDRERAKLLARLEGLPADAEPEPAAPKPEPDRRRLTKSTVRALPVPDKGHRVYWDTETVGFGVRVSAFGRKSYFVQCRTRAGRGIKLTIGTADRLTAEQARQKAREMLAQVDLGKDPAAERKAARQAERERRQAPDLNGLWGAYAKSPAFAELRPKSQRAYESWWRLHVAPALGRAKVADLTARDAARQHERLSATVGRSTANRCSAVLSALMAHGVRLGLVGANVCRGAVRANPEPGRERLLDDAELGALLNHLAGSEDLEARVLEFLLSTGGRKGEVLAMRWGDLNGLPGASEPGGLTRWQWWTVPAAVSKSGKAVRRPLNAAARDVLARLERRHGDDLVFGVTAGRLGRWWQAQRATLELADVKVHDLRHCAASSALWSKQNRLAGSKSRKRKKDPPEIVERYRELKDEGLNHKEIDARLRAECGIGLRWAQRLAEKNDELAR